MWVTFGNHPRPDPGIFLRILQRCEMEHFFHISGKTDRIIYVKISIYLSLVNDVPLNLGGNPDADADLDFGYGFMIQTRFPLAKVCAL